MRRRYAKADARTWSKPCDATATAGPISAAVPPDDGRYALYRSRSCLPGAGHYPPVGPESDYRPRASPCGPVQKRLPWSLSWWTPCLFTVGVEQARKGLRIGVRQLRQGQANTPGINTIDRTSVV